MVNLKFLLKLQISYSLLLVIVRIEIFIVSVSILPKTVNLVVSAND
jgi:hypothetical protein